MNFVSLHTHSHFSLLDGLSQPFQIAERCAELGMSACAITDHGSISGAVQFTNECNKNNIKPIIGIECYVTEGLASEKSKTNIVSHQVILAKNYKGWLKLIQLVSRSNDKDVFYYKPRIDIDIMREICDDNLISFSGHWGSTLESRLDNLDDAENYIYMMKNIFGPNNFFIEIQRIDPDNFPEVNTMSEKLRSLALKTNTKTIATGDSHYIRKEDAIDHRVLLCSSLQLTFRDIKGKKDVPLGGFFKSNCFHIPTDKELLEWGNTQEEIDNTQIISDMCEFYKITGPPKLPKFDCPDNMSENDYLRQLCKDGWQKRHKTEWNKEKYTDRLNRELGVIEEANLAGYFLIVQDYVNWAKNQGWLIGPGRGSAAGSLISYLLNITNIDPIKHDLIFSRFYNKSRNRPAFISFDEFPFTR